MLEECGPIRGGPYPAHEGQGRTWFDDCPEQSDGPGSGRPSKDWRALFIGPAFSSGTPTNSQSTRWVEVWKTRTTVRQNLTKFEQVFYTPIGEDGPAAKEVDHRKAGRSA